MDDTKMQSKTDDVQAQNSIYDLISNIESEKFDKIFTTIQFALILILLYDVRQYGSDAQLFPLVVGIPTSGLLLLLLISQVSTRVANRIEDITSRGIFDQENEIASIQDIQGDMGISESDDHDNIRAQRKRVLNTSIWIFGLFILIMIVGFLPAILLFMALFYRIQTRLSWKGTIFNTTIMWLVIVIIFEVVLNTPFYRGILGINIIPF